MDDDTQARSAGDQDPTWARLEDQLAWYDRNARAVQPRFKALKVIELIIAALLPVVAGVSAPAQVGLLGAAVVVLEGVQHLFQYQANWILYRATAQALERERYLYLASAGPYDGSDRHAMLAERIEGLIPQEHPRWNEGQQQPIDAPTHRASA